MNIRTAFGRTGVLSCALLALAACASGPAYAPQTAETARLRSAIVKGGMPDSTLGDMMTTLFYDAGTCENRRNLGLIYTFGGKKKRERAGELNMPLGQYTKQEVDERLVDAGMPLNVVLQLSIWQGGFIGASTECLISTDMTFEPGKDYEYVGIFNEPGKCTVTLNELVSTPAGAERKELAVYTNATHPAPEACVLK